MKERPCPFSSSGEGAAEAVGRARVSQVSDTDRLWRLAPADEVIADRLLSLGIAGITGFSDGGKDERGVWLVRSLPSASLTERMRERRGPWPFREALPLLLALARSLAALERQSLFAGPIVPEQVRIRDTTPVLLAEGLVRSLVGAGDGRHTATDLSPKWTPPAQADGAPWDSAANRYVLGLIAYRLLAGEHPFSGAGLRHALVEAQYREAPPFVESVARDLPSGLQSFVLRLLHPDIAERPKNAAEIVDSLVGFLREETAPNPRPTGTKDANRVSRSLPQDPPAVAQKPREAKSADGADSSMAVLWIRRIAPLAAAAIVALFAVSLLKPPQEPPKVVEVPSQAILKPQETAAQDCASCHPRQSAEWRRSVMAHSVKSPLFNGLEILIEEQVGKSTDCPNGAGALRKADSATACRVAATGLPITGSGGEHWCISCHSPSENLEFRMPAWDGRPGGDARTRLPPRDLLGNRAMEGISCGFCHQVHGPVGSRGGRGYQGNPVWTSFLTGAVFPTRPEDASGLLGIGNSGYDLRPEELILPSSAVNKPVRPGAADPVVHALPTRDAKSYLGTSEFCGACHDVRLFGTDTLGAAKGEHFKRLRNAYSEWRDWAATEKRAGRVPATCQDCHMSLFPGTCVPSSATPPAIRTGTLLDGSDDLCPPGMKLVPQKPGSYPEGNAAESSAAAPQGSQGPHAVTTHYFSGVDVPLGREFPDLLIDETTLDAHAIPISAKRRRDMLLRATFRLNLEGPRRGGAGIEIPVVVENVGGGHRVPAGFSQEREFWIQLTVKDKAGGVLYEVGRVSRPDEDLHDKELDRVNVRDDFFDRAGQPLGVFGADVRDGRDVPLWSPNPIFGGNRFRGKGLVNFQNGFLRCVRCIGVLTPDGRCDPLPGQEGHRADRFDDGDYDLDTGECRSNLTGFNALFETYFPVGGLDASRGTTKGPDAIIDTRSMPPGVPITYIYDLPVGGRRGPFFVEARLLFRAFPPYLIKAFAAYERQQASRGLRPSGPLVTDDMLKRLEIVELGRVTAEIP